MKVFFKLLAVFVLSVPIAVFGTFMLGPLWAHIETAYGIESVGHAMYAGWCFVATYAVIVALGLVVLLFFARRGRRRAIAAADATAS